MPTAHPLPPLLHSPTCEQCDYPLHSFYSSVAGSLNHLCSQHDLEFLILLLLPLLGLQAHPLCLDYVVLGWNQGSMLVR